MITEVLYTAAATAEGGRGGRVATTDGRVELDLEVPVELGGPGGPGTNPEQLFAAGYAACFRPRRAGLERAQAAALMPHGHEECPYSRATRGNIDVVLRVHGAAIEPIAA